MHCKVVFLSLVIALSCVTANYVNSIYTDELNGQIYIAGDNDLFEVDIPTLKQNNYHNIVDKIDDNSLFIKKTGNKRFLYGLLLKNDGSLNLETFKTPIPNGELNPVKTGFISNKYLSLDPTYDAKDSRGIFTPSRNLTLVNLDTLKVLDSFEYFTGSRIFGRQVIYNHNNKHVIIFQTRVPVRDPEYGITVAEYDTSNNKFQRVQTTYNCMCDTPAEANNSPFLRAVLEDCAISYSYSTNGNIFCGDPDNNRLFNFQANNLSNFQVIHTEKGFTDVAWDFQSKVAYTVLVDGSSFNTTKINLVTGKVIATKKNVAPPGVEVDSYIMNLDADNGNLYIAAGTSDNNTPPLLVVKLSTLDLTVVPLTKPASSSGSSSESGSSSSN